MERNIDIHLPKSNDQLVSISLMTLKEVIDMVKLSKTTIYGLIAREDFPKPIKSGNASRWVYVEIGQWITNKMIERDAIH